MTRMFCKWGSADQKSSDRASVSDTKASALCAISTSCVTILPAVNPSLKLYLPH